MEDRRRQARRAEDTDVSPRFNRALIVAGVIVLAVISTLLLFLQDQLQATRDQLQATRAQTQQEIERQEQLILEIRAQARLNACLNLKLAKRHGIDTAGLDSPSCKVFSNGAVVFPGAEPGSLLDPAGDGQATPDNGGKTEKEPTEQPPPSPAPEPPPDSPGPPNPPPTPICIDLPPPLDDVCLPAP